MPARRSLTQGSQERMRANFTRRASASPPAARPVTRPQFAIGVGARPQPPPSPLALALALANYLRSEGVASSSPPSRPNRDESASGCRPCSDGPAARTHMGSSSTSSAARHTDRTGCVVTVSRGVLISPGPVRSPRHLQGLLQRRPALRRARMSPRRHRDGERQFLVLPPGDSMVTAGRAGCGGLRSGGRTRSPGRSDHPAR